MLIGFSSLFHFIDIQSSSTNQYKETTRFLHSRACYSDLHIFINFICIQLAREYLCITAHLWIFSPLYSILCMRCHGSMWILDIKSETIAIMLHAARNTKWTFFPALTNWNTHTYQERARIRN